ncbi:hypothetical protein M1O19_01030 [Dehalococcoidia bacterium]|nr:hypothetical protein [Dehalococcoidia bacterium]MCL0097108.1 hypothetical protein [Dehalococcoidia bacterium]
MKKKMLLIPLLLVLALSPVAVGCPPVEVVDPLVVEPLPEVHWRVQAGWPAGFPLIEVDYKFVEMVYELSGGRFVIELFYGGEMVPVLEGLEAVGAGVLEGVTGWGPYWAGIDIAFDLFTGGPFWMSPTDLLVWTFHGGGLELKREIYAQHGAIQFPIHIGPIESGFRGTVPLRTRHCWVGVKARAGALGAIDLVEELGGSAVLLPGGEIYMALKMGVVDVAEFASPKLCWGMKLQEVAPYWNAPGWHSPGMLVEVIVSLEAYEALPPEFQRILDVAATYTMTWAHGWARWGDQLATHKFYEYGVEFVRMADECLAYIERLAMERMTRIAAQEPTYAKVLRSQLEFMKGFATLREIEKPFHAGRTPDVWPELP